MAFGERKESRIAMEKRRRVVVQTKQREIRLDARKFDFTDEDKQRLDTLREWHKGSERSNVLIVGPRLPLQSG